MDKHPERNVWRKMKDRCANPRNPDFLLYGARGIAVCPRWATSFQAFLEDMGPRPTPKHSIDRMDGTKGYEPGNCRWATPQEQARNRPEFVTLLAHAGKTQTVAEWAAEIEMHPQTLYNRVRAGWPTERALTEPIGARTAGARILTAQGRTQTLAAWARETGLRRQTIKERLRRGDLPDRAIRAL